MTEPDPIELETARGEFKTPEDARPRMPEPPPVKLVAVADVVLPAPAGVERDLDDFYLGLLQFARDEEMTGLAYRAENFILRFEVVEALPERDRYRALQVEVPCLADAEAALIEAEMEYTRQRGLVAGSESLLLLDPAGNWVELVESRKIAL